LVINENINSGLLKSQVIEPIKSIEDKQVKLINIHKIGNTNKAYTNSINLPIAIPYKLFLFNYLFFLTPVFALLYAVILSFIVKRDSIVVARSYFPSLVTFFLKKIRNINYVFDTRSLFIDENTLNGNIKMNSLNYKMWRYFEKKILCNSYKTTAVSIKHKEFHEAMCSKAIVELIPCYVSTMKYIAKDREQELRKELGYKSNDIVITYYGSLDNGWNSIDMYAEFFKECTSRGYKVLVISQHYENLLHDDRINIKNVTLLNTTSLDSGELVEYLQVADYGVVLMKKAADWETRLSVKFVEYLNAGLQVIVGEYVGEAVRYSREEFSERSVICRKVDDIDKLVSKKNYTNDKVTKLFGYKNIGKII
ncbi:MAG: hypothetical protein U9N59_16720, partial [Campylobacterota bacterium]|nr:hypothetical protein [Campylobacterota bacterium]